MVVSVKICGSLRKKVAGHIDGELRLELGQGTMVSQVLDELGLGWAEARVILVNGRPLTGDRVLEAGDRLALFPAEMGAINEFAIYYSHHLARPPFGGEER